MGYNPDIIINHSQIKDLTEKQVNEIFSGMFQEDVNKKEAHEQLHGLYEMEGYQYEMGEMKFGHLAFDSTLSRMEFVELCKKYSIEYIELV